MPVHRERSAESGQSTNESRRWSRKAGIPPPTDYANPPEPRPHLAPADSYESAVEYIRLDKVRSHPQQKEPPQSPSTPAASDNSPASEYLFPLRFPTAPQNTPARDESALPAKSPHCLPACHSPASPKHHRWHSLVSPDCDPAAGSLPTPAFQQLSSSVRRY